MLLGVGVTTFGLLRWEPRRRLFVALGSLGMAVVAIVAAVIADKNGAW